MNTSHIFPRLAATFIDDNHEGPVENAVHAVDRDAVVEHLDVSLVDRFFGAIKKETGDRRIQIATITNNDELLDPRFVERLERAGSLFAPQDVSIISMQFVRPEELEGLRGQYEQKQVGGLTVQTIPVVFASREIIKQQVHSALKRAWEIH